jgi:hypothetical protein
LRFWGGLLTIFLIAVAAFGWRGYTRLLEAD